MKRVSLLFLLFVSGISLAQSSYESLNRDFSGPFETYLNSKNSNTHTGIKPYLSSEMDALHDSIRPLVQMNFITKRDSSKTKKDGSHIEISPVFIGEPGISVTELKSAVETAGGGRFFGNYKKKLAWDFVFLAGKSSFPNYIDSIAKYDHIIPEMGYAYQEGHKYAYQYASGYLSYSPNKIFNLQAGKDKNFWGDGYRSLFLSDVSNSYPFAKITANVWHIKYVVLYAMHKDLTANSGYKSDEKNKYGTFHYISWNVVKRLNLGLFESVVWQGSDTARSRGFDVNYMNPLVFFRPVEYSLGSSDNAFFGGSFKIKIARKQQLYGQVILDEFYLKEIRARKGWWANKQGIQLGFKDFDLFRIKGWDIQGEFNYVRPYTYSHGSVQQNYGNFAQPLAHPLGANFEEVIGLMSYRSNNWLFEGKAIYAFYGADTSGKNFGHDIFKSYITRDHEYGNSVGQGYKTNLVIAGLRVAYLFTNHENLEAYGGMTARGEILQGKNLYTFLMYVGVKTALWNTYRDY